MNSSGFKAVILLQLLFGFLEAADFDAERDVIFLLRVRNRTVKNEEVFHYETKNLISNSEFDPSKPTTFLIHGYMEHSRVPHHLKLSK